MLYVLFLRVFLFHVRIQLLFKTLGFYPHYHMYFFPLVSRGYIYTHLAKQNDS